MEILIIIGAAMMAVYYVVKQIREPGIKVFPFNQVDKYQQ